MSSVLRPAIFFTALIAILMLDSCNNQSAPGQAPPAADSSYKKGSFGFDLAFLRKHDSLVVLSDPEGKSKIIVSPKFQGKVFTSTASGDSGTSFGWVNYKAFDGPLNPHMNGYGGENRFWLGPEGGPWSLFFAQGSPMEFGHWKTPAGFDSEPWTVAAASGSAVTLTKQLQLTNYKGSRLFIDVRRSVRLFARAEIFRELNLVPDENLRTVGYIADNAITNAGPNAWDEASGMPCIWMLDMFNPSDRTVIFVPFQTGGDQKRKVATSDYFGQIPADRLKTGDGTIFFRADGKSRGKLGLDPSRATPFIGSYDGRNNILTVARFDMDASGKYLNQEWRTDRPVFSGDAVNAYNDGPLADGSQMGPFYEMESVSPAARLKPGAVQTHRHAVFHFTGPVPALDNVCRKLFHIPLEKVNSMF